MRTEKEICKDYLPEESIHAGQNLVQSTNGLYRDVLEKIVSMIKVEIPLDYPYSAVWWYSVLMGMDKDADTFWEFIRYVKENRESFSVNTQYFLFYQLSSLLFRFKELDGKSKEELWVFYREIVDEFSRYINPSLLEPIPVKERNKDMVVVITEQFIGIQHGPTKTALDRCKTLIEKMGKKVLLINSAEVLSLVGKIPFWGTMQGIYSYEKLNETYQEWKGISVPYFQCDNNMPNFSDVETILQTIRNLAPERIITIGKGGILGNLAARMVPALTIGLCPSDLEYTCAKYQTLGRKLNNIDIDILSHMGYTKEHVIEGVFAYNLKEQTEHITRGELGIPENSFLIAVIGARLDCEVTDEFMKMLEDILEENMRIVFIGNFEHYDEYVASYPKLKTQSKYLGFCNDILSRTEICDLYVNPLRKGGGGSAVESMIKGVPVVSVNYGDVAVNAGEDFCVNDYSDMKEMILKYSNNKSFYDIMSNKAKERANVLLDADLELVRIIQEMDKREEQCAL